MWAKMRRCGRYFAGRRIVSRDIARDCGLAFPLDGSTWPDPNRKPCAGTCQEETTNGKGKRNGCEATQEEEAREYPGGGGSSQAQEAARSPSSSGGGSSQAGPQAPQGAREGLESSAPSSARASGESSSKGLASSARAS